MRRTRGFIDLVFDLVEETTNLVERTHDSVLDRSVRRFTPSHSAKSIVKVVTGLHTAISGGVFGSIRMTNRITRRTVNTVADVVEAGLVTPTSSVTAGTASRYADNFQSLLNGFWGDYLSRSNRRLDIGMALQNQGASLPVTPEAIAATYSNPTSKICVFVHGLAATESLWSRSSEKHYNDPEATFGTRLRSDLGMTPIYLRYNTGRHISENGRLLAKLLTDVMDAYPVPVEEIALVGHSMGGLVVRSAAHYARELNEPWLVHLHHVVCIASPHLGAPLEKAVNLLTGVLRNFQSAGAQVPAELLDRRSAGVKDLRYGFTVDEDWSGQDPDEMLADTRRDVPHVDGVGYHFLAATISRRPEHPLGQLLGDLMVRLPSASGEAARLSRRLDFSSGAVFSGMNHLDIANHPDVYEVLRGMLAA